MPLYSGEAMPVVMPPIDGDALADWLEAEYQDEFCASASFDPDFVDSLCAAGFIAMAWGHDGAGEFLIPRLHMRRSVMSPRDVVVTRTSRRMSSRYSFGLDMRFGEVLEACVATHGEGWLRPPLMEAWRELFATRRSRRCRFASMELYRGDALVAGEIGIFVGCCYTSLTGFRRESGSGTVQLAAAGRFLEAFGVSLWDLGVPMDYKDTLGAHEVPRSQFLSLFRAAREKAPVTAGWIAGGGTFPARGLIDRSIS